ncbi:MAG: trimethylamine methyltransferase family protein [Actinobacteria bacterium]|nr:trimethylamine methyltransferase family protein [Actinomycetota bacterium]
MAKYSPKAKILTDQEIEKIHKTSLRILNEIGISAPNDQILELLQNNGAKVDKEKKIAKLPTELVERTIKFQPKDFSVFPPDSGPPIEFGDSKLKLSMDTTPDIVDYIQNEKRRGTVEDVLKGICVGNALDNVRIVAPHCLPSDVPQHCADVICYKLLFTYSKKVCQTWIYSSRSADYVIEMAKVVAGGENELRQKKLVTYFAESISPLQFAPHTLEIMVKMANYDLPIYLGPMVSAGGSGPVTLAGTIALENAEVLAGMVLIYLLNPRQPVVYSGTAILLDLKIGLASYGSPEQAIMSMAFAQMARRYNMVACCLVHLSDSNLPDFQRGYEAAATLSFALSTGAEVIGIYGYGSIGVVGSGVGLSLHQEIMDNEGLSYMSRILRGVEATEDTLAFDLIKEVGIGGNFICTDHTYNNMRKEQWSWDLFSRQSYSRWSESGKSDILKRSDDRLKEILTANYPPQPVVDEKKINQLEEIVNRAIKENY